MTTTTDTICIEKSTDEMASETATENAATAMDSEAIASLISIMAGDCVLCSGGSNEAPTVEKAEDAIVNGENTGEDCPVVDEDILALNEEANPVESEESPASEGGKSPVNKNKIGSTLNPIETVAWIPEQTNLQRRSSWVSRWKGKLSREQKLKCPSTPEESQRRQDELEKIYKIEKQRKLESKPVSLGRKWCWKKSASNGDTDKDEEFSDTDDSISIRIEQAPGLEILHIEL